MFGAFLPPEELLGGRKDDDEDAEMDDADEDFQKEVGQVVSTKRSVTDCNKILWGGGSQREAVFLTC